MGLIWHRPLTPEDVETANRLLAQHQPVQPHGRPAYCANATHSAFLAAPSWPCARVRWAESVLDAERRHEVPPRELKVTGERTGAR